MAARRWWTRSSRTIITTDVYIFCWQNDIFFWHFNCLFFGRYSISFISHLVNGLRDAVFCFGIKLVLLSLEDDITSILINEGSLNILGNDDFDGVLTIGISDGKVFDYIIDVEIFEHRLSVHVDRIIRDELIENALKECILIR